MKTIIQTVVFIFFGINTTLAQTTYGPNSPVTGVNNTSGGVNAWTTPAKITASDFAYSSAATRGFTNYLQGTNFGFAITSPSTINGISLEIQKQTKNPKIVSFNASGAWTAGLTRTTQPTVTADLTRCIVFIAGMENGLTAPRDLTSVTYGGQAMTLLTKAQVGGTVGFSAKIEVWYLLDAGIVAAGAATTFVPTFAAGTLIENVETYTSAVFDNVDQNIPVSDVKTSSTNIPGALNANYQLGTALNVFAGAMAFTANVCGANTTPASVNGGTATYANTSPFTEGADIYAANTGFPSSGMCFETSTAVPSSSANTTQQPSAAFKGIANRQVMVGFVLQKVRDLDVEVNLLKAGSIIGSNFAQTITGWPSTLAYSLYGSNTSLWGTAWTAADINATNFGASISAKVQNGIAQVDHMRITVYATSTLPISLLTFEGECENNKLAFRWATASETNNDYFEIEQSADGVLFQTISKIKGAGNSMHLITYKHNIDNTQLINGYYRLKQTDYNGDYSYSPLIIISCTVPVQKTVVYPNPSTTGIFNFQLINAQSNNEVSIYDEQLKFIATQTTVNQQVNLSAMTDGNYYVLFVENGKQTIKQLQKISRSTD